MPIFAVNLPWAENVKLSDWILECIFICKTCGYSTFSQHRPEVLEGVGLEEGEKENGMLKKVILQRCTSINDADGLVGLSWTSWGRGVKTVVGRGCGKVKFVEDSQVIPYFFLFFEVLPLKLDYIVNLIKNEFFGS